MRPGRWCHLSDRRAPWWRPNLRDVVVLVIVAAIAAWMHWPSEPPGPVEVLRQGGVGDTGWSVLGQRAGSGHACVQVRVGGARRALMCDQHWDRDVHRLWRGPRPPAAGPQIGPPSLLRVRFPGGDRVLVVSVLYDDIAVLRTPPRDGADELVLRTIPLYDTDFHYVVAVLDAADAGALEAFAADGERLFYHYVE
jgi:hypothetical protein